MIDNLTEEFWLDARGIRHRPADDGDDSAIMIQFRVRHLTGGPIWRKHVETWAELNREHVRAFVEEMWG